MPCEPLDIAFLVTEDAENGTYQRYHNLARALVQIGHEVSVYSQTRKQRWKRLTETRDGVRYLLAPSFPGDRLVEFSLNPLNVMAHCSTGWPRLGRHCVYHLFQPHPNAALLWLGLRAWQSCRPSGSKYAVFAYDWDDLWGADGLAAVDTRRRQSLLYRALDGMEHALPRRADFVTTVSEYLTRLARERGAQPVFKLYNGVWKDKVPPERSSIREEFGLQKDAFYLAFTGWTAGEIHWCFEALCRLPASVRMVCCGYDVRPHLKEFREASARVDYLGVLRPEKTRRVLQGSNAGLLPLAASPFNESRLPMKFAEYLSAGLPVICSDIGEIGLLGRNLAGVCLLPSERNSWIHGCVAAVQLMVSSGEATEPSPSQVEPLFSWSVLAAQLELLYTNCPSSQDKKPVNSR